MVYTESQKHLGSFINAGANLAQLQDQIEEICSDEQEVIVEYQSSTPSEAQEDSKTYKEIIDDIKIKEFNLERSFNLDQKI